MKTYTITTPIYYINDKPHIGHTYSTVIADTFARYHRLKGEDTFFLTGTDENSLKNVEAAKKAGYKDIQAYLDMQSAVWQHTWESLGMSHNDFIRTTEERHKKGVAAFFERVNAHGDIYKGTYQGFYCKGCEAFVRQSDLTEEGTCPFHKTKPETIEEENYFFAASKYRDALLAHIESHPEFVQPQSRRNEIVNYIRDHFEDVSITRQSLEWGIPLPTDPSQVIYVWFDALINYLTGIGFGWDEEMFARHWPAQCHIIGKDIIKFHCALWPAMLLSAGLPLPERVFAHGFFTIDGQRIGKSLGNAIDPVELVQKYGRDALRYFLLREIPFGGDGDFSFERVEQRYQSDLAKGLGNFVSRTLAMASKADGVTATEPAHADEIKQMLAVAADRWQKGFEEYALDEAFEAIWDVIRWGDRYIDRTKPWVLAKENPVECAAVLSGLLECVRQVSVLIAPILPDTAEKIWSSLGMPSEEHAANLDEALKWRGIPIRGIMKGEPLFPPLS